MRRVLGVLNGGDFPADRLCAWAESAEVVIAADGAADRLLAVGIQPETTIGDMDSISSILPLRRIIRDPDQDTSDCDKLLNLASRMGYEEITLVGMEGDRLDHTLAALASAARASLGVRVALRTGMAWVIRRGVAVDCTRDSIVSLIPLEACTGVTFTGVQWPLAEAEISALGLVSLSNRATEERIEVKIRSGAAALFVLDEALLAPWWPTAP